MVCERVLEVIGEDWGEDDVKESGDGSVGDGSAVDGGWWGAVDGGRYGGIGDEKDAVISKSSHFFVYNLLMIVSAWWIWWSWQMMWQTPK